MDNVATLVVAIFLIVGAFVARAIRHRADKHVPNPQTDRMPPRADVASGSRKTEEPSREIAPAPVGAEAASAVSGDPPHPKVVEPARASNSVDSHLRDQERWLREALRRDAECALVIVKRARVAMHEPVVIWHQTNFATGTTPGKSLSEAAFSRREGASDLFSFAPFIGRSTVDNATGGGATGQGRGKSYYIAKARDVSSVQDVEIDAEVVPWSSQTAGALLSAEVGQSAEGLAPGGQFEGRVTERATFRGKVLPEVVDATYHSERFKAVVDGAGRMKLGTTDHHAPGASGGSAPEEYRPRGTGGLDSFVEHADVGQWRAFHWNITSDLIVEGPPGSGKTSIAVTRIPCMIDRQWSELNIRKGTDWPRYSLDRTIVVVATQSMRPHLQRILASMHIETVQVVTLGELVAETIRGSPFSLGRAIKTDQVLAEVQGDSDCYEALLWGIAARARDWMAAGSPDRLIAECGWADHHGERLKQGIARWAKSFEGAIERRERTTTTFGDMALQWWGSLSSEFEKPLKRRHQSRTAGELITALGQSLFDRASIVEHALPRMGAQAIATRTGREVSAIQGALSKWRSQIGLANDRHQPSEAIQFARIYRAYLAPGKIGLPSAAFRPPSLLQSHIVVDEAQDLTAADMGFVRSHLAPQGVLTLVGDPQQQLEVSGSTSCWQDASLASAPRVQVDVNYRQSKQIGEYLRGFYRRAFGSDANWRPGPRESSAEVRTARYGLTSASAVQKQALSVIAEEAEHYRRHFPEWSVAVLWVGSTDLSREIETALRADAAARGQPSVARLLDREAIVAGAQLLVGSAREAKGMEFDAVIVLDCDPASPNSERVVSAEHARQLYVALSRACEGLSLVVGPTAAGELLSPSGWQVRSHRSTTYER